MIQPLSLRIVAAVLVISGIFLAFPSAFAKKPSSHIVVMSTTLGAEILLDGKRVGTVPMEDKISVSPGVHSVELRLRGYSTYMEKVKVRAGRTVEVEIDLIAVDGIVRITTTNIVDATIYVDEDIIGSTPFDGSIPAGDHTLRITKPGFEPDVRQLRIQAGKTYNITVELIPIVLVAVKEIKEEPPPEASAEFYETWWFWTLTSVVVLAGATTGIVLGADPKDTLVTAPYDHLVVLPDLSQRFRGSSP